MNSEFQTPILFIIFNRPDTTQLVFEQIKRVKPKKLFIAADGPRLENSDDVVNCLRARKIVNDIDWDCQVSTLFRDKNLGCGKAVSSAINWFFEKVEEGIILEDDCIPDLTFFGFCRDMLMRYKNEPKVMMISGTNCLGNSSKSRNGYFFSCYYHIWGWATWRRAWDLYNFNLKNLDVESMHKFFRSDLIVKYWLNNFNQIVNGKIDTWDYQWTYTCIKNHAFSVVPFNNLVSNVGYLGSHTLSKRECHDVSTRPIDLLHIIHPSKIESNKKLDKKIYRKIHALPPATVRNMIKKVIPYAPKVKRFIKSLFIR